MRVVREKGGDTKKEWQDKTRLQRKLEDNGRTYSKY